MWRNYLLTAYRTFVRQRGYALINLLGLTTGLTCTLLIALWVHDERQYDRFHAHSDQLYRVVSHMSFGDHDIATWTMAPQRLADLAEAELPEVERAVLMSWESTQLFEREAQKGIEEKGFAVSPHFFQAFSFPMLRGDSSQALAGPQRIVLTESMARRFFGPDWARDETLMGTVLRVDQTYDYVISGVCADPPAQSSLQFAYLMPVEDILTRWPYQREWNNFNFTLYLQLQPQTQGYLPAEATLNERYQAQVDNPGARFGLQPMTEMHLFGTFENGQVAGGRITYVRIFTLVAIFLLLIACINYMNLATARASKRAREVGVRKVVGATRRSLMQQFFGEALFMALAAMALALVVTDALLPAFNQLTVKQLSLPFDLPGFWGLLLGVVALTGLLSGLYPAVLLSAFPVVAIFRGGQTAGHGGLWLRRGLVVFQFGLSIVLICGTLLVYQQMRYIQTKELGLEREQIVQFMLPQYSPERLAQMQQRLAQVPGILHLTATDQPPYAMTNSTTSVYWPGKPEDLDIIFHGLKVHHSFAETFGIDFAAGRDFSPAYGTDTAAFLVNETAVEAMGLTEPVVGQPMEMWGWEGQIIGVMKDFHTASLHSPIEPVIAVLRPDNTRYLYLRLEASQTRAALAATAEAFAAVAPGFPFRYAFLDQEFARMYESERVMRILAAWAAGVGIFIACLGLLGLATFMAEQRSREMSIRKVLGASTAQLMLLLTREFSLLVLVAFGLAVPLAYLLLQQWLEGFAYRVGLSPWLFAGAGLFTLLVAWATVAGQALRAASADPAEILRTE